MSRQFPIWFNITNCNYKSSKDFGFRETGDISVKTGSSASNSNHFLDMCITKRLRTYKGEDAWVFKFSIDDVVLKIQIFSDNAGRPGELIKTISKLNKIKSLVI